MARYVELDALVAEIVRIKNVEYNGNSISDDVACCALDMVIDAIDTIEMKEVDLKKEFSQWWKDKRAKDYNVDILYERYSNVSMKLAKHFFELGLKVAQKRE